MKSCSLTWLSLLLSGISLYAQQNNDSVAAVILYTDAVHDASKTGNDKHNWTGFVSGVADLGGSDGKGSLTFSSTIWQIVNLKHVLNNDTLILAEKYRQQWFIRNFSINASFTPDNKKQFSIDDGTIGFKYAILNNRVASRKDYKGMEGGLTAYDAVDHYMVGYLSRNPGDPTNLGSFIKAPHDTAYVSNALRESLRSRFKVRDIRKLFADEIIEAQIKENLSHKTLWTISLNDKYDFQKEWTDNIVAATEVTFYVPMQIKKKKKQIPFDFTLSETWAVDTTKKFANFDRGIFEMDFGKNIAFSKKIELKPSFGYVHTDGPLYKKEKQDKANASLTFRFKINNQFWLPISLKYEPDTNKAQFFGFLSVQYSLK